MSRWKYWDKEFNRLVERGKTGSSGVLNQVRFKVQSMDCALRFIDTGQFADPKWPELNKTLGRSERRNIEKYQKKLVNAGKNVITNL